MTYSCKYIYGLLFFILSSGYLLLTPVTQATANDQDLTLMSIEELMNIEVTSVSRAPQKISSTAAAVFVITQDDIRRSGVTTIPQALRMAPGIQVAQINSSTYAISSRGLNGRFTNKLLVLIDGRTVYNPTFSGVYWDVQDTLLEDIDRIEVIRGPGATMWGANAVNGVINVITKSASATEGGLVTLGTGNQEQFFSGLRYGTKINESTAGRAYIKYFQKEESLRLYSDDPAGDDWKSLQGGFRIDGTASKNEWTLQGDIYNNNENMHNINYNPPVDDNFDASGWNILANIEHHVSENANVIAKIYYDHTERDEIYLGQEHDILDIDLQHNQSFSGGHSVIMGLGYRNINDDFKDTKITLTPPSDSSNLYSVFAQGDISLLPDTLHLIIGTKIEHNDYTGYEVQPNIRFIVTPENGHTFWGSVARAVRTPSRAEHDSKVPIQQDTYFYGNNNFTSESLIAYELGYRTQPVSSVSIDIALFYNDYEDLRSYDPILPLSSETVSMNIGNRMYGQTYGFELALDWSPLPWWTWQASYTYTQLSIKHEDQTFFDLPNEITTEGSTPDHQLSLRSSMQPTETISFDIWAYYVNELEAASITALTYNIEVSSYVNLSMRIGWQALKNLELSLVGQNLLDGRHMEFIGESFICPTEIRRSIYGQIRWTF